MTIVGAFVLLKRGIFLNGLSEVSTKANQQGAGEQCLLETDFISSLPTLAHFSVLPIAYGITSQISYVYLKAQLMVASGGFPIEPEITALVRAEQPSFKHLKSEMYKL